MKRITVVCQNVGNYYGMGEEYVRKLLDGFRHFMPANIEARYVCITDDPESLPLYVEPKSPLGLTGWWCKMAMFSPETFEPGTQILACDLDTLITGDLSNIASYDGDFAAIDDPYHPEMLSSSLMIWTAGHLDHVWHEWNAAGRPTKQFGVFGDGGCIGHFHPRYDSLQKMFRGQIASYKADCRKYSRMPADTRVLYFHGLPKPHACTAPFVKALWNRTLSQDVAA